MSLIGVKDTFLNQEQETFTNEIIKKFGGKQVLESNNGTEEKKKPENMVEVRKSCRKQNKKYQEMNNGENTVKKNYRINSKLLA